MHLSSGIFGALFVSFAFVTLQCGNTSDKADLILTNAKVWTVDKDKPLAEAVAVKGDKILAVGTIRDIDKLKGSKTEIIDLNGKLLLPGFNDCHTHTESGGFHLLGVDLKDAKTEQEFGELLATKSRELPPGTWITGGSWDHDKWPGGNLPTAELIDKYVPDRPVLVSRYDGHMSVANSLALKIAGVTAETPDSAGGEIVRKPGTKEPAGVLRDNAAELVANIIPQPSKEEVRLALETALKKAREQGITTIQQVDLTLQDLQIYRELLSEGNLTARIYGFIPIADQDQISEFGTVRDPDDVWINIGGVKGFLDGSLGSSTALFFEPYTQDPSTCGLAVIDYKIMKEYIRKADKAGFQITIHAIGDKANSDLLEMYDAVIRENGPRDRRFRIEHAQHIRPGDFKRFAELGVIASMQPYHAIDDGRFAEKRIGYERCKGTYAFHSFLENRTCLAFGSDWPVAPLEVIPGIYAAVTRRTLDNKNPDGWFPEQKISVEQAVEAYTLSAAYAQFQEHIKGSITPGKLADLAVLSDDIFSISPEKIEAAKVLYTIVNGKIVYKNKK